jgi:hypothetical protein
MYQCPHQKIVADLTKHDFTKLALSLPFPYQFAFDGPTTDFLFLIWYRIALISFPSGADTHR